MAIVYDDVEQLVNKKDFRVITGFDIAEHLDDKTIQAILDAATEPMKVAKLPMSPCSRSEFPFKNFLSYYFYSPAYRVLVKHMEQNGRKQDEHLFVERLEYDKGKILVYGGFSPELT